MTPSRDLVSHHVQRHSTKSTDCTYLPPYSYRPTFSIHQILSIYYWESVFLHCIVEKRTIRHRTLLGLASSSSSPPLPALQPLSSRLYEPSSDQTPSRNQKGLVTDHTACWTQQVRHCGKPTSRSMRRAYLRMDLVG